MNPRKQRRTWRPLRGRLRFPGRHVRLDRPGKWSWRRRKQQRKREGSV